MGQKIISGSNAVEKVAGVQITTGLDVSEVFRATGDGGGGLGQSYTLFDTAGEWELPGLTFRGLNFRGLTFNGLTFRGLTFNAV